MMTTTKKDFIEMMKKANNRATRRAMCNAIDDAIERDASRDDFIRDVNDEMTRNGAVVLHTMIH